MVELNLSDKITVLRVMNVHDEVHHTSVIGKSLSKINMTCDQHIRMSIF